MLKPASLNYVVARTVLTLFILLIFSGCTQGVPNPSFVPPNTSVCPDTYVTVDTAILTKTPYQNGDSMTSESVFSANDKEVYCTFWLTGDLCCTTVVLEVKHNAYTCFRWVEIGNRIRFPQSVTIKPENGLKTGNYTLNIYLDTRMVSELSFQVL
jgi:hypothetical protein